MPRELRHARTGAGEYRKQRMLEGIHIQALFVWKSYERREMAHGMNMIMMCLKRAEDEEVFVVRFLPD